MSDIEVVEAKNLILIDALQSISSIAGRVEDEDRLCIVMTAEDALADMGMTIATDGDTVAARAAANVLARFAMDVPTPVLGLARIAAIAAGTLTEADARATADHEFPHRPALEVALAAAVIGFASIAGRLNLDLGGALTEIAFRQVHPGASETPMPAVAGAIH